MLNKQLFDEQLDLAQSKSALHKISFERALLIHTDLYVKFGMGSNRDPNNPEWRYFIRGLSFATCRKEWGYKYYQCCATSPASQRK
jgi:hypothetical protein